jgi:hypothetical protein
MKEAEIIANAGGRLVSYDTRGARQLGDGKYLTSNFQGWPPAGQEDGKTYFDCAITVDEAAYKYSTMDKAYIPKTWCTDGKTLSLWGMITSAKYNQRE